MKHITVNTYRKDKYYPRVMRAFAIILSKSDVVAPVDVLIETGNLSKKDHDAWRQGKVPFLERVFEGNLSKANRILRIIGFHAHDLNMVAKITHYHQWGKGKKRALQFSKSGDKKLGEASSKHYRWNQSPEKKQEIPAFCLKLRYTLDNARQRKYNVVKYNVVMKKLRFEWDPVKSKANLSKHRISFEEATTVFYDNRAVEFYDDDNSEWEDRFLLLGISANLRFLMICHCYTVSDSVIHSHHLRPESH